MLLHFSRARLHHLRRSASLPHHYSQRVSDQQAPEFLPEWILPELLGAPQEFSLEVNNMLIPMQVPTCRCPYLRHLPSTRFSSGLWREWPLGRRASRAAGSWMEWPRAACWRASGDQSSFLPPSRPLTSRSGIAGLGS